MPFRSRLAAAAAAATGACAASVALERRPGLLDGTPAGEAASGLIALVRFSRALRAAVTVMADYRLLFARHREYASDAYRAERAAVHARSADRLLALARTQGAVYVKIGQHVASMSHAVPPEYTSRFRLLEDRAAYRPFPQIRRAVVDELRRPVPDLFDYFEERPVAAASLAQVHRARLRENGQHVAIKVQYPGLEALVRGDLTSIRMLSWLLSWVFPYFNMGWVVDQFKKNLDKELDFRLEAESAKRTDHFFEDDPRICVPKIYDDYTTPRILTMQYIDGFRVDDLEALQKTHVDPHQVSQAVVDAFAKMIFVNGFVHCDPHAGNLMVRPGEDGKFELFLLDHGLYRELDDEFRQSYCKLWKGLVLRSGRIVDEACAELGAPGFANVFSIFLLNRSWTKARRLDTDIRVKMSKEELKQLRNDLKEGGLKSQADISSFVESIPDDLLLVFKMTSLVRNVNKSLGASVNRFKVNARYAVKGLRHLNGYIKSDPSAVSGSPVILAGTHSEIVPRSLYAHLSSLSSWVLSIIDTVCIEVHLILLDTALFAARWWFGDSLSLESDMRQGPLSSRENVGFIG